MYQVSKSIAYICKCLFMLMVIPYYRIDQINCKFMLKYNVRNMK